MTDRDWYSQLYTSGPEHEEVNFWFPSASAGFGAVQAGEFFVLKTHVDHRFPDLSNRLVGVGVFSGYARLRLSEAWHWFGTGNGVNSEFELRDRIERYRRAPIERLSDPEVGCVLLRDALFFSPDESLPPPPDFSTSIVRGKTYDLDVLDRTHPVVGAITKYLDPGSDVLDLAARELIQQRTRGDARLVIPRVGQRAFRALVAEAYHHRCALTGDKVRPVLEAAHIVPVGTGGQHRIDNGVLLRSDMHTLFDRGYIGIDPHHNLRVSPALREQFGNGDWLYAREGAQIALPDRRAERPNPEYLEWHMEEIFVR